MNMCEMALAAATSAQRTITYGSSLYLVSSLQRMLTSGDPQLADIIPPTLMDKMSFLPMAMGAVPMQTVLRHALPWALTLLPYAVNLVA